MKVELTDFTELEDGGGQFEVICDEEFIQMAVQHFLLYALERAIDPEDDEYDLVKDMNECEVNGEVPNTETSDEEAALLVACGEDCNCKED